MSLLSLSAVSKSYPGVKALEGLSFDVTGPRRARRFAARPIGLRQVDGAAADLGIGSADVRRDCLDRPRTGPVARRNRLRLSGPDASSVGGRNR